MTDVADYIYPRLPGHVADQLVVELSDLSLPELRNTSSSSHPQAAPAATGGHPIEVQELTRVRELIREIADDFGFPYDLSVARQTEFDRICGTKLLEAMRIVPADAANADVWSFMSLVLAPEIGPWRFPNRTVERLRGGPRNTFQRLWWRAWALGPDLTDVPEGCLPLGEDDYVQIMERPTLGGNRVIAVSIRDAIWRADSDDTLTRSEIVRGLTKRVLALKSHIALDALDSGERAAILDGIVDRLVTDAS